MIKHKRYKIELSIGINYQHHLSNIKQNPLEISIRGRERQEDREKKKDIDVSVLVLGSFIFKSNEVS